MKNSIIRLLQTTLGYDRYLRCFSRYKIRTLSSDKRKQDFLYFKRLIPSEANVLVIGANTGITTVPISKLGKENRVFAYEPVPSNFKVLQAMAQHYSCENVQCFPLALGAKTGEVEMILPVIEGARKQGLAYVGAFNRDSKWQGEKLHIPMDMLDERPELRGLRVDAIKLVAENAEAQILQGARKVITSSKPLIYCELWPNENRQRTMEVMKELGYRVYYRKGDELKPWAPSEYHGKNFFFKPHYG